MRFTTTKRGWIYGTIAATWKATTSARAIVDDALGPRVVVDINSTAYLLECDDPEQARAIHSEIAAGILQE